LSATNARNRWISAAQIISPGIEQLEDDDVDFLAASFASQKTVCSDAFDFLFDSQNLNPERILEHQDFKVEENPNNQGSGNKKSKGCCVIS
jgi:hypothetical protein